VGDPVVRPVTEEEIAADWVQFTGGGPVVGLLRQYNPSDVDGLSWHEPATGKSGVVTWSIDGERAEITSVHAEPPGGGTGTRLMDLAEAELRRHGVRSVVLATTNDNIRALNFYTRRGYRLTRVHADAMDRVRVVKPGVPMTGRDGIPLRDMWELEKGL